MRADGDLRCAFGDAFCGGGLVLFLHAAGQPYRLQAQRNQPFAQLEIMLFGEYLGRGHECDLIAVLYGLQCGECRDDRLAAAHIAQQ